MDCVFCQPAADHLRTVQFVGRLIHKWKDYCDTEHTHGRVSDEDEETARAILGALAEAGRLLPPGVLIEEKFGVMGDETIVKTYRRPYVMGHASRESAEEYIADQREDWPDHNLRLVSRWSSPWVPVGTEETPE